jgi:AcrR family transcriptional regulator
MPVKQRRTRDTPDPDAANPAATRQRLVAATIECLAQYGVEGATVRRIVAQAGVNIAAVNYHFGSKDALLREALDMTVHEAFTKSLVEVEEFIARAQGDVVAGTRAFFRDYLPNAFGWARIAVAHLRGALVDQDYSGGAVRESQHFIAEFFRLVRPGMRGPDAAARLAVEHVWATIFLFSLLPQIFVADPAIYRSELMVEQMVRTLFDV